MNLISMLTGRLDDAPAATGAAEPVSPNVHVNEHLRASPDDERVVEAFTPLFRDGGGALPPVLQAVTDRGWRVWSDGRLNLVGCRSRERRVDRFDDLITAHRREGERWRSWAWPATTDPGADWLGRQMGSTAGTAVLAEGQYPDAFSIGSHRNRYTALVQSGEVAVHRDRDRDGRVNDSGPVQRGHFGINLHRASANGRSSRVGSYSAGCQVLADIADFRALMALATEHKARFGDCFAYTLIVWP